MCVVHEYKRTRRTIAPVSTGEDYSDTTHYTPACSIPRARRKSMEVLLQDEKKLSVRELKRYCEEHKPHCIYFKTENQAWYRTSDPCKLDMAFSIMLICENPNLICLKSSGNTLSFDRVKSIEVDTDASILGTVITIFVGTLILQGMILHISLL